MTEKKEKTKRKKDLKDHYDIRNLTHDEINDFASGIVRNEIFTDRHLSGPPNEITLGTVFMPLFFMEEKDREFILKHKPNMIYAYMKDQMETRSISGNPCFGTIHFVWKKECVEKIFNRVKEISKFMGIDEASGDAQETH